MFRLFRPTLRVEEIISRALWRLCPMKGLFYGFMMFFGEKVVKTLVSSSLHKARSVLRPILIVKCLLETFSDLSRLARLLDVFNVHRLF
uniref:Uncharacterized protein n=1 Tax=Caenorhabditis japonica TaxID=281687 RepID=A0A8R1E5U2_CAEJA